MRCDDCFQDPCVCQKVPAVSVRDTSRPIPKDAITKEEFGLELFEAIVCCGSILQLQQLREKTPPNRIKQGQLRKWQVAELEQKARLRDLTKSLTDADLAELMRRYPFVSKL